MTVDVQRDGAIAVIRLNRPEALNALDTESLRALFKTLNELGTSGDLRAVILTGAGERAFSAGADIREMQTKQPRAARQFALLGQAVTNAIEAMPQPVIAAVRGAALGGGCEIACACDFRIAAADAIFGQPEVSIGIAPGWGATQRLTRLIGIEQAKEMILAARRIPADEALAIGLVCRVVPAEGLMPAARELAERVAANAPLAVAAAKRAINRAPDFDLASGLQYEAEIFGASFATVDQLEGMTAFLEKRRPTFTGQ